MSAEVVPMPDQDVYDLDAVIAEQEPVAPFRFRFDGDTYELPGSPDMRAFALMGTDDPSVMNDAFRILLGDEQWDRMKAADQTFDGVAFALLMTKYQEHLGTTLGESPAS